MAVRARPLAVVSARARGRPSFMARGVRFLGRGARGDPRDSGDRSEDAQVTTVCPSIRWPPSPPLSAVLLSCRMPSPPMKRTKIAMSLGTGNVAGLESRTPEGQRACKGPREALRELQLGNLNDEERHEWVEGARLDAILGGMRLSMPSVRAGLRCYIAFVGTR